MEDQNKVGKSHKGVRRDEANTLQVSKILHWVELVPAPETYSSYVDKLFTLYFLHMDAKPTSSKEVQMSFRLMFDIASFFSN